MKKIKKKLKGKVISNKMNKTIVVLVQKKSKHPLYGKYITKSTKYHVHDEKNKCNIGDIVLISECRPYSKTKNWNLISVANSKQE